MEGNIYTIFELMLPTTELFACKGCGQAFDLHQFRQNKNKFGEYCKRCQRVLGRAAMRRGQTLFSKLEEIQTILEWKG